MSLLTQNVIPGNHGKIFGTNASTDHEMEQIKQMVQEVDGVKKVVIITGVFPREFIVYTTKLVDIVTVENAVNRTGLHAIPKGLFGL